MDAVVGPGGAMAFTGSEPDHPTELYYLDSPDPHPTLSPRWGEGRVRGPRRLTDFNAEVAGRSLGKVETMAWKVGGGFETDGIVVYPPDFTPDKKKYPLVLLIHGGPQSASVERFDSWGQIIAAKGYIVFEPNYRGSDHRGKAYMHAIVGDWGKGPGEDVMAGLDALKKRGFIDETRIAVTGWSYGGYMTTWLIGHYHDWKTAIAGAAVTDWRDMYDLSDGNVQRRDTLRRLAVGRRLREAVPRAIADHVRAGDEDADADPVGHGRRPGADHAVVPAVPRAEGQQRAGEVRGLPDGRPLPRRPSAAAATCSAAGSGGWMSRCGEDWGAPFEAGGVFASKPKGAEPWGAGAGASFCAVWAARGLAGWRAVRNCWPSKDIVPPTPLAGRPLGGRTLAGHAAAEYPSAPQRNPTLV